MSGVPSLDTATKPDSEVLRHLHETERKNYWEAANLLAKGLGFYLAISAAVLTYILTKELPKDFSNWFRKGIAATGFLVTLFWVIAFLRGVGGLFRQAEIVANLFQQLTTLLPQGTLSDSSPRYLRRSAKAIAGCCFAVVLILLALFAVLLFH